MRVIIDGEIYHYQSRGGISRIFNEIIPRMCGQDDSLDIALLTRGDTRQPLPRHQRVEYINASPLSRRLCSERISGFFAPGATWLAALLLERRLRGRQDSIWHSSYYTLPEKWRGPIVMLVPDMIHEFFPELFTGKENDRFRERKERCVRAADYVLSISETTARDIERVYKLDRKKIRVIPLACTDAFYPLGESCSDPVLAGSKPFLLYVGPRVHYKNFDMLLDAYHRWPGNKDVDLVVVSYAWTQKESQTLVRMGISDKVRVMSKVDDKSLCRLYNRASAFVYPSLYEGFGIPLLEALTCGCPVIASRIPSSIEIAGDCPFYFDPENGSELIRCFDRALSEGRNRERVNKGFEQAKQYSWDRTAAQTLEVYRELSLNLQRTQKNLV